MICFSVAKTFCGTITEGSPRQVPHLPLSSCGLAVAVAWASEGFIPRSPVVDFPGLAMKVYTGWLLVVKILFSHSKLRNQPIFAKNILENVKFQNPGELDLSLPPSSDAHNMGHYLWGVERVKRFLNVHLHCIVSNLQMTGKMSILPPTRPGKISADAHVRMPPHCSIVLQHS